MPLREAARRRAPRLPVTLAGTLRGKRPRPVTLVDLSLNGCLLRCEAALDKGSIHDLELPLVERGVRAKARVTESSRDGAAVGFLVGLEFVQVKARDLAALRSFLDAETRRCARSR